MARNGVTTPSLGLQSKAGMSPPRIKPPRLAVATKVGMIKGKGFGAGGLPNTIAAPPALSKKTQAIAEQKFAKGGRVSKSKGKK